LSKQWPHDKIRELLALASAKGRSKATLSSERDAELFRFAIYAFRTNNNIGQDLIITLDGNTVKVEKKDLREVMIVE
jgi:hypothetical protein